MCVFVSVSVCVCGGGGGGGDVALQKFIFLITEGKDRIHVFAKYSLLWLIIFVQATPLFLTPYVHR